VSGPLDATGPSSSTPNSARRISRPRSPIWATTPTTSSGHRPPSVGGIETVLSASELGGSEAGEPPHPAADVTRQRISETTNEPVGRTRAHGHCGAAPRRSGSCASGRDGHQILMAIVAIVEGQGVQDALPAVEQSGQVLTLLLAARADEVEDLQGLRRGSVSRRYRNPCRTCTGPAPGTVTRLPEPQRQSSTGPAQRSSRTFRAHLAGRTPTTRTPNA
jgi:hypothetical protein